MKPILAEELLLLALDDESGKLRPIPDRALDFALAGALLADLSEHGRIFIRPVGAELVDTTPFDHKALDHGLRILRQSGQASLQSWLHLLAAEGGDLRNQVIQSLIARGVLREENAEFLWVFHVSRYPLARPGEESAIRDRLRDSMLNPDTPVRHRDGILMVLVQVCQLGHHLFSAEEWERCRARIKDCQVKTRIGRVVTESIQEIQRALLEIQTYSGM